MLLSQGREQVEDGHIASGACSCPFLKSFCWKLQPVTSGGGYVHDRKLHVMVAWRPVQTSAFASDQRQMTGNGSSDGPTASTSALTPAEAHVQRTLDLLAFERDTDLAQTSLLVSKCSPKLLESGGLAILNLQACNVSIGLGGKTLVELERWMKGPLPSHGFRNGDTCEILSSGNDNSKQTKKGKGKEKEESSSPGLQGVVYRVQEDKIVIALDQDRDRDEKDFEIPEKCRL